MKLFTYLNSSSSKSIAQVCLSTLVWHCTNMLFNITHVLIFVQVELNLSLPRRTELQQTDIRAIFGDVEARDEFFEELSNLHEMKNRYACRAIDKEKDICRFRTFCRRSF